MNLSVIYDSGLGPFVAVGLIALFAILLVGAIVSLVVTVRRERAYANASLPELHRDEETRHEEIVEELDVSAFDVADEEPTTLQDVESNRLMEDIGRAQQAEVKTRSAALASERRKTEIRTIFSKKNNR